MSSEEAKDTSNEKASSVLQLIEAELETLNLASQRSGVSVWALLGGAGAIGWLIISEIEKAPASFEATGGLFVIFSILHLLLSGCAKFLDTRPRQQIFNERRYATPLQSFFDNDWSVSTLVFMTSYFVGFWVLCFSLDEFRWTLKLEILSIYLACAVGLLIIAMILVCMRVYLRTDYSETSFLEKIALYLMATVFVAILSLSAYLYIDHQRAILEGFSLGNVKIAILMFALAQTILLLVKTSHTNPMYNNLIEIRRALSLEKISPVKAAEQLEIIFAGMKVKDLFKDDVSEFLRLSSAVEVSLTEGEKIVGMIREKHLAPNVKISAEDMPSITDSFKLAKKYHDLANEKLSELNIQLGRLRGKIKSLSYSIVKVDDEYLEVINLISSAIINANSKSNEFAKGFNEAATAIQEKSRAEILGNN